MSDLEKLKNESDETSYITLAGIIRDIVYAHLNDVQILSTSTARLLAARYRSVHGNSPGIADNLEILAYFNMAADLVRIESQLEMGELALSIQTKHLQLIMDIYKDALYDLEEVVIKDYGDRLLDSYGIKPQSLDRARDMYECVQQAIQKFTDSAEIKGVSNE